MTAYQTANPFFNLTNATGDPVTGGRVYIGVAGLDPETNPQAVYWDAGSTLPASQPLQLKGGYIVNGTTPSLPYTASTYSIRAYDALGNVIYYVPSAGNQFSGATGAALIGYTRGATGAVTETVQTALRSQSASIKDFGAVGDGTTDDTTATQAFMTAGGGYVPPGTYKLTAPVEIPVGADVFGQGGLYRADTTTAQTIFHIAHTGKGFTFTGASGARKVEGIGTKRTQPTPGVGWTPTAHDWDFYIDGATDVHLSDILLLNPTKGIICTNAGGRHTFARIWGQPLSIGIQIDTSYDVTRIDGVHFWDFWSASAYVTDYTTINATALYSLRNDNPDLYDIFAIFYRYGLRIGNWSGGSPGTTSRLRAFGLGFDACGSGLYIDAAANGSTVELHGFYAHGHATTIGSGNLIDIQGTNGTARLYGRTDLSNAHRSAINVAGSGALLAVNDPIVSVYNMANGGYTAVTCASGAYAELRGAVGISGGVSGTASYSGAGRISGPLIAYTPVVTSGTGAFTGSATVTYAYYQILDGWCEVFADLVLATNNTAATDVRTTLPFAVAAGITEIGIGRQVTANKTLQVQPIPSTSLAAMVYYDGTYPGATGANITFRLKYRV